MTAPAATVAPPGTDTTVDESLLGVVRILLLLQGAIGLTSLIEVTIAGAAQGLLLVPLMVLTGGSAIVTLGLAGRIQHRGRRARRAVVILQHLWLVGAAIDLLLSLAMTQRFLEPVPTLTRIVVPLAIIRMLRSSRARQLFGLEPSRRQRRRTRRAARSSSEVAV